MAVLEALRMALESIRSHRLRSSLTLLGMVIGVFAIIVSVTAVAVIDVYFKESLQFLGSSTFTVTRMPTISLGHTDRAMRNRPRVTYEQLERLGEMMQLPVSLSPMEGFHLGKVKFENKETAEPNISLIGSNQEMLANYSFELDSGRFFTEEDVQYARPVAVLGSDVVTELFPNENPNGKSVRMDGRRYQVIGVLKPKGSVFGFSQDNRMFTPITRAFSIYGSQNRDIAISVRVHEQRQLRAAIEEATGRMRVIRRVAPGDKNNFEISTNDTMKAIFEAFTATLTVGGAVIGLIALLGAGIGIMNIMLVSVTERTREIGIRKSVGARRKDILRQFLLEAFFLCQIGGFFGIVLGGVVGNGVALYFDISTAFPVGWAVGAVAMVTGIALLFGGYPAFKAARLHPIESLRYE
ncbi:MAG: ABC transporter permease [Bacteroidetes bacterium]|nr:ABC transporter permease [Bacteroidota bacterium]